MSILDSARDMISELHNLMGKIEKCDAMAIEVNDKMLVFLDEHSDDEGEVIYLEGCLTEEQMETARELVINMIISNKNEAENKLALLTGKELVEQTLPEEELNESKEVEKEAEEVVAYPEMTVDEVKKVYTNGTMTIIEAANYFGVNRNAIYRFITQNKLKKTKNGVWRDEEIESKKRNTPSI